MAAQNKLQGESKDKTNHGMFPGGRTGRENRHGAGWACLLELKRVQYARRQGSWNLKGESTEEER